MPHELVDRVCGPFMTHCMPVVQPSTATIAFKREILLWLLVDDGGNEVIIREFRERFAYDYCDDHGDDRDLLLSARGTGIIESRSRITSLRSGKKSRCGSGKTQYTHVADTSTETSEGFRCRHPWRSLQEGSPIAFGRERIYAECTSCV